MGSFGAIAKQIARHRPQITSMVLMVIGVLAGFAVTYMIGRNLGLEAIGQYAVITQTAMFIGVFGLFGLDQSAVRHFSKAVAERKPIALAVLLRFLGTGFGIMTALAFALVVGGLPLWERLFDNVVDPGLLGVLAIMTVGRGGALLLNGLLRSQHRFGIGMSLTAIFMPGASAIALGTGIATTVGEALWAAAFGTVAAVIVGLITISSHVGTGENTTSIPMRAIFASSLPLWGVGLIQSLNDWYTLTISARMLGAADAGLFRVGVQVAGPMQMAAGSLFAIYAAQISTAFHAGDRAKAAKIARSAVMLSSAIVLPLAVAILFGGEFLLAQIGSEFVAAYRVMAILVIGQTAFTLTGPCGLLLAMSGHERINLLISLLGTAAVLVAVPLAAKAGGLEAMAACLSAVMLARNVAAYLIVRYKVGIRIWAGEAD